MFKKICLFLATSLFFSKIIMTADNDSSIVIRLAEPRDINELIRVDRVVTYEYFEPIFVQAYAQYDFGQHPRYYIELDLAADKEFFKTFFDQPHPTTKILVAEYNHTHIAGYAIISLINTHETELEHLYVEKEFRGKHVGKKLVQQALKIFPNITACNLYTMQTTLNASTHKFYEKMGFKNMGPAPITCPHTYYDVSYHDVFYWYRYELTFTFFSIK